MYRKRRLRANIGGAPTGRGANLSDQLLIEAMARTGRQGSAASLQHWRSSGLLPQFKSRGLGRRGKAYFWTEPNILACACCVFDALAIHSKLDDALWSVWLAGYPVPPGHLRKAFRSRRDRTKDWTTKHLRSGAPFSRTRGPTSSAKQDMVGRSNDLALNLLLNVLQLLVPDSFDKVEERTVTTCRNVISALELDDDTRRSWTGARFARLARLVQIAARLLERSDLVSLASDVELSKAHNCFKVVARFLYICDSMEKRAKLDDIVTVWPLDLALAIGAPLFLLILFLVRCGYEAPLERTARLIEQTWADDRATSAPNALRCDEAALDSAGLNQLKVGAAAIWQQVDLLSSVR